MVWRKWEHTPRWKREAWKEDIRSYHLHAALASSSCSLGLLRHQYQLLNWGKVHDTSTIQFLKLSLLLFVVVCCCCRTMISISSSSPQIVSQYEGRRSGGCAHYACARDARRKGFGNGSRCVWVGGGDKRKRVAHHILLIIDFNMLLKTTLAW